MWMSGGRSGVLLASAHDSCARRFRGGSSSEEEVPDEEEEEDEDAEAVTVSSIFKAGGCAEVSGHGESGGAMSCRVVQSQWQESTCRSMR